MTDNQTKTREPHRLLKVVVLTDLHMVPDGDEIIGIDPYARLEAAVAHINRRHGDAARVIVMGDLAHGGDLESYMRVRKLLDGLAVPSSLMMGNHDHRTSARAAFPELADDGSGFVQSEVRLGQYRLLLLDTLHDPAVDGVDGSAGYLCKRRLDWLSKRLAAAGDAPVVMFMHHPPMLTGFPGMDRVRLHNGDDLLQLIRRHRNVRHLIAGHIHRTISGAWHDVPFAVFKSPVHQQPLDFSSASSSLSVDEPGAYGVLLLNDSGVVVHSEDYELASQDALV